jgi:hypothetical protein
LLTTRAGQLRSDDAKCTKGIVGQPVRRRAAHIVAAEECAAAAIRKVERRRSVALAERQKTNRNAGGARDGGL